MRALPVPHPEALALVQYHTMRPARGAGVGGRGAGGGATGGVQRGATCGDVPVRDEGPRCDDAGRGAGDVAGGGHRSGVGAGAESVAGGSDEGAAGGLNAHSGVAEGAEKITSPPAPLDGGVIIGSRRRGDPMDVQTVCPQCRSPLAMKDWTCPHCGAIVDRYLFSTVTLKSLQGEGRSAYLAGYQDCMNRARAGGSTAIRPDTYRPSPGQETAYRAGWQGAADKLGAKADRKFGTTQGY